MFLQIQTAGHVRWAPRVSLGGLKLAASMFFVTTQLSLLETSHCVFVVHLDRVPPKSSILTGFSLINNPFCVPLFLETSILSCFCSQTVGFYYEISAKLLFSAILTDSPGSNQHQPMPSKTARWPAHLACGL